MKVEMLRRDAISPNPEQPRKLFDPDALDDLAASIRTNGLLQPITVRPAGDGTYQIVAGERRWRACGLAGIDLVPCIVRVLDDREAFIIATMENVARADMNPIEEANALRKLLDVGMTMQEIEDRLGMGRGQGTWKVTLLDCIVSVQHLVSRGLFSQTMAGQMKNARYMEHRVFQNLVENIRRDGRLESVPLTRRTPTGYRCLSGNHRVQAAKEAGISEVLILVVEGEMSRSQEVAKQLSHNSLVGADDMAILRDLWAEIDDVSLKYYAGIDDRLLGQLEDVSLAGLTEARMDFQVVSFAFLKGEGDRLKRILQDVQAVLENEAILARWGEYDRLMDALAAVKSRHNVTNGATALMLMLDIVEEALSAQGPAQAPETA